jgi:2-keto-3-deoxy-L-fuconate dehydrogenase
MAQELLRGRESHGKALERERTSHVFRGGNAPWRSEGLVDTSILRAVENYRKEIVSWPERPVFRGGWILDELNLTGKVAVITGGASGIGRAIAKCFAAKGAQVRVLDIEEAIAKTTVDEITEAGGNAFALQCDVTDNKSVEDAFSRIAALGPLDILVNSAGIAHVGTIATTSIEDFERVFRVNVKGTFLCMQAALRKMVEQGYGTIVNLASIAATSGLPDRFAYSMSKGAVLSMTLSVARDFLSKNIRCNCISPARVHTPFVDGYVRKHYPGREEEMLRELARAQPIGRMAEPEEVAALVLYLCSDLAGFLTGADIPLDGGFIRLRG